MAVGIGSCFSFFFVSVLGVLDVCTRRKLKLRAIMRNWIYECTIDTKVFVNTCECMYIIEEDKYIILWKLWKC